MTLPKALKEVSLKDWIWICGAFCTVVGSWFILKNDVSALTIRAKDIVLEQKEVDAKQDQAVKEMKNEIVQQMNRNTDEIKQEIRDLRKEVSGRR